jgi:hypothetical protein
MHELVHVAYNSPYWFPVCVHKGIVVDQGVCEEGEYLNVQLLSYVAFKVLSPVRSWM